MKKIYTLFAAALTISTITSPATLFAEENKTVLSSNEKISVADKFITFNQENYRFEIDKEGLKKEVTDLEFRQIVNQVTITNNNIKQSMANNDSNTQISVVDFNGTTVIKPVLLRKEGKNDLEYHWNYVRVYLSATTVRLAVGAGCVIGGLKIEATVVKCALGLLGISIAELRSGIWFDFNYLVGVACLNAGFQ